MTQYVINIGAIPNDGTGDPLRTAFNETNLNFNQVFAAGPVLSNIQIANNTILTTNTNGNLVLAPNGTGVVQSNVSIVPNLANLRNLGSATNRWNTVYTQYIDYVSGNITTDNITITGVLTAPDIVTNLIHSDDSTFVNIQDGLNVSGDVIAETVSAIGNITGNYFIGNGSQLTGIVAVSTYGNSDVATFLANFGSNTISTTGNITSNGAINVNRLFVNQTANAWGIGGNLISAPSGATWISDPVIRDEFINSALDGYINLTSLYANGNAASQLHLEHGLAQIVVNNGSEYIWAFDSAGNLTLPGNTFAVNYANGNPVTINSSSYGNANVVTYGESGWAGNIVPAGNNVYSLGNATNQWSDLYVSNATIYMNNVPIGLTSGNVLTVDGEAVLTTNSNAAISTTGNITADYFFGNIEGSSGNIPGLTSVNFDVVNISARDSSGVNIGAGGYNNLVVLPTEVLIQNVPLTVAGNILSTVADGLNITANTVANGIAQTWNFGTDGRLTFPGTPRIDTGSNNFEVQAAESINFEANAVVNIYTDTSGSAYNWIFDNAGNLTLPGNTFAVNYANGTPVTISGSSTGNITFVDTTMSGPENSPVTLQALDNNSLVGASLFLDPNSTLSRLETWSAQDSNSWTTADWATGVYTVQGGQGAVEFTGATAIIDFINSLQGTGQIFFSVNGGPQLVWDGTSSGGSNITFYTPTLPDTDPTTVTSFAYYYSYNSGIVIDYDQPELLIYANSSDLTLETSGQSDIAINSRRNLSATANGSHTIRNVSTTLGIDIRTDATNTDRVWLFGVEGNLTLPISGNIVGATANNNGYINWLGNSSGDGNGYTTLRLVPDNTRESSDQYLIIDPTAPGHIHIRAGGTQDNSGADLILGGENSYVKVTSGTNPPVYVSANNQSWMFGTDGVFQAPGDISTAGNVLAGNISTGGDISATGNITGTYILGNGSQLTGLPATYGNSDVTTLLAAYGSNTISTTGNITAGNFIGNISVTGNVTGTSANVTLVAGSYSTVFDNTGIATFPGTISTTGNINSTAFAVGNGAVNNCAIAMTPAVGTAGNYSFRDYSTANSAMYFDTTIGSANTGGSFVFRGSNAYTTYATINSYGVVQPTLPSFRVYGNGNTINLGNTVNTTGNLNINNFAVDYAQGNYLDTSTGVFTAPVAGLYSVTLVARTSNDNNGTSQIAVVKNGSTQQCFWEVSANSTVGHMGVSSISRLAAGDTLAAKVLLGTINFDSNDQWSVAFLG